MLVTALTVLFSFALQSWAQVVAPPPTSFPDVPSTPPFTTASASSTTSASTPTTPVTITSSSVTGGGSGSPSVSGSATQTSSAQFPSLSGYSSCVSQCLATSISMVGCQSLVDVNCFCPSDRFPMTYATCLASNCPTEVSSAESLAQQFCRVSNSTSTSLSFPTVPPTASAMSSVPLSSASASATGGSAASNDASTLGLLGGQVGVGFGMALTVLSVVLGGYIVD